ncbi:Fe-S cluster assembly protein SufD [Aureimonas frigidaquae]|uniref:SUF system FeS cluster assembly SufBD core domain-containing protein n=1 Tax=Aureimonas frigidaquae TaxID=424757 RepID=A0A0P0Z384_9HYPH|nr:Fe-S cluster assembly protein SufD [Aureimonas frigidaquae]BAT28348.1 hypothetical protein [Aureimonas frigidaquae]
MALVSGQTRTPAELALIERAQAGSASEGQRAALTALRDAGLPSRRVEAWHYTDLRVLLDRALSAGATAADTGATLLTPLLAHSIVVDLGAPAPALRDGLAATPSDRAPDWSRVLNHMDRAHDTIRVVNAAMGATGSRIEVADGVALAHPVELRAMPGQAGAQSFASVTVGAGSSATFVERIVRSGGGTLSTSVGELALGNGADVLWIIDQEKAEGESHLGQLTVSLGADSKLRVFVLNAGGTLVRQEIHCETKGEGADIQIRGVNLLAEGQHIDVTTTLTHSVAHTTATEIFRNVVLGGHGVFQGMIKVARGAQKTDAKLACNTLLLSDDGDFSAKPELEIFADDVQCGHGATAGEIDANHLFYLMSRGIPEREARALLVRAFVDEVVQELEDETIVEALEARIDGWLATH